MLDSLQLTNEQKVATPANWNSGDEVVIATDVSDKEAAALFPSGFRKVLSYLRFTSAP